MNKYYDPNLSQETLETYQGYSLQVFTSGRIKLSFHVTHRHRNEYYAVRHNRFREAYAKQHQRSRLEYPEHFAMVSDILERCPNTLIHRVHLTGDNNATVDHAHALTDISGKTCHVVLNTLHHAWELPTEAVQALHLRGGPKVGTASILNEYMPSYEHDWMNAVFVCAQYSNGYHFKAAEREVPLHSKLEQQLDTALPKTGRLFPTLTVDKVVKAYARLPQTYPTLTGTVFHSTRKWFITQCERTGVPEHYTATLVGHHSARSTNKLTYTLYSGGISDAQKRDIVDGIKLPDCDGLS